MKLTSVTIIYKSVLLLLLGDCWFKSHDWFQKFTLVIEVLPHQSLTPGMLSILYVMWGSQMLQIRDTRWRDCSTLKAFMLHLKLEEELWLSSVVEEVLLLFTEQKSALQRRNKQKWKLCRTAFVRGHIMDGLISCSLIYNNSILFYEKTLIRM